MPAGAIDLQQTMRARCDVTAYFQKMLAHGFKVYRRHNQPSTYAAGWTHSAEHVGPAIATIAWCSRPAAARRPDAGERALLANAGLVLPPDLKRFAGSVRRQGSSDQGSEVFLCVSWAVASCSGWNGRAVSFRNDSFAKSLPTLRS